MKDISNWCDSVRKKMEADYKESRRLIHVKATKKWRHNNREHYNNYQREYYKKRMADPEYRARRQAYAHAQYLKKKEMQNENLETC